MKALIQRVRQARVEVDSECVSEIGHGMLVLVGIDAHDTDASVKALSDRLLKYRLFSDEQGRMNLNIQQSEGEILMVSQFTLSAETKKGLRPGFSTAASPEEGERLFNLATSHVQACCPGTQTGIFGADMQVFLQNDGPVTFLLEN